MNQVKLVAAAFPIARFAPKDPSKIVLTGNPLRPEVTALWGAPYPTPLPDGPLRLLVFGGSQGARAFSDIVPAAITRLPHDLKHAPVGGAAMPPGRYGPGARDLRQRRSARRACALLHRPAAPHGGGATGDRPRRRRHRRRIDGDRPSRHSGAAAPCPGRQPDSQCRNSGQGRRRLAGAAERFEPGFIGPDARPGFSPIRPIWPTAPPPRMPWRRRMPPRGWPMWSKESARAA